MSRKKSKALAGHGRGAVGKAIVTGVISREIWKVVLRVIPDTRRKTLQGFLNAVTQKGVIIYSDEHNGHGGLDRKGNRRHETVNHSKGDYVEGCAGTNRMESIWAVLKRAFHGTRYHLSRNHLSPCIHKATGRHNMRQMDIGRRMSCLVTGMVGHRLGYVDLVAKGESQVTPIGRTISALQTISRIPRL